MRLKTISISESNYEILRNFGKTGMSFNDVISELITKVGKLNEPCLNDNVKKMWSDHRPGNQGQTMSSSNS
jgi:predicted CopG family antitoxin